MVREGSLRSAIEHLKKQKEMITPHQISKATGMSDRAAGECVTFLADQDLVKVIKVGSWRLVEWKGQKKEENNEINAK